MKRRSIMTKLQKKILDYAIKAFDIDSIISEYDPLQVKHRDLNCYILIALEAIKDYDDLEVDAIDYITNALKENNL